jgi:hypothetical protein
MGPRLTFASRSFELPFSFQMPANLNAVSPLNFETLDHSR